MPEPPRLGAHIDTENCRPTILCCSRPAARRQRIACTADRTSDGHTAPAAAEPASPPQHQQRRRHLLSAAAGAALLAASQLPAAQAVIQGYEPMPGLQGKDYGKQRMRWVVGVRG